MTAETSPQNGAVINPVCSPAAGAVAIFTACRGRYVTWVLALGDHPVMTTDTVTGNIQVIELPAES